MHAARIAGLTPYFFAADFIKSAICIGVKVVESGLSKGIVIKDAFDAFIISRFVGVVYRIENAGVYSILLLLLFILLSFLVHSFCGIKRLS